MHRYPDADFGVEFGAEIRGVIAAGRSSQPLRAAGVDQGGEVADEKLAEASAAIARLVKS